jgi:hypothetical protein
MIICNIYKFSVKQIGRVNSGGRAPSRIIGTMEKGILAKGL